MTKQHARLLPLAALATIGVLALASCTPTEQQPVETPSASATPTPAAEATPEPGDPAPTQESAEVPESEEEAIAEATKVVKEYNRVVFELQRNPDLGVEFAENFVLPQSELHGMLEDTIQIYSTSSEDAVAGEPITWTTRDDLSYAAPSRNVANGEEIEFGAVLLKGCSDNTKTEFLKGGKPDEDVPSGIFPAEASLIFVPESGTWLLRESTPLTEGDGVHQC